MEPAGGGEEVLESIKENIRRAYIYYKEKRFEDYECVMRQSIPQQVENWIASYPIEERESRRTYLKGVFSEELKRVENAWVTSEFLDAYWHPQLDSLRQDIEKIKQQLTIITAMAKENPAQKNSLLSFLSKNPEQASFRASKPQQKRSKWKFKLFSFLFRKKIPLADRPDLINNILDQQKK